MGSRLMQFARRYRKALVVAGVLLAVAGLFGLGSYLSASSALVLPGAQSYPEVAQLDGEQLTFQQYQTYFQELARKKGAVYAYQVMLRASFPSGIDLHLLGHVVGDVLYQQKGIGGITYCTPDFRNACSHSIVIGALLEHGPSALSDIAAACKKAPGGPGAYTMCFHGLGHGVLAYTNYDLQKAVQMCAQVGTPEYQYREQYECIGGTIMEMISGVHDPVAWQKQVAVYFKQSDPLYPCDASWMPEGGRSICYVYLTPHLFTAAGGNLGNLTPDVYPKAFSYCDALPKSGATDPGGARYSCYNGFGKEFIVIAQGRDIRNIGSMPASALANVRDWCALAHDTDGELACDESALASLFWGGENTPDASFTFCGLLGATGQETCYDQLADNIRYYHAQDGQAPALCARLPQAYQQRCAGETAAPGMAPVGPAAPNGS